MLSNAQRSLLAKHAREPRKTDRFCGNCGGKHAGNCILVATSHGTRCRPDILAAVEQRFRDQRSVIA